MSRSRPLEVVGQIGRRLPMILGGFDPPVLVCFSVFLFGWCARWKSPVLLGF
jgi:hypothetical protein